MSKQMYEIKRARKEKDIKRTKDIKRNRQIKQMHKTTDLCMKTSQSFIDRDAYNILILDEPFHNRYMGRCYY